MSTQSIITIDNLPTHEVVGKYFAEKSTDLLKHLKFDLGCVDHNSLREALMLKRISCSEYCYITAEEKRDMREIFIRKAINKINEL